jgi:hypothetical protein
MLAFSSLFMHPDAFGETVREGTKDSLPWVPTNMSIYGGVTSIEHDV